MGHFHARATAVAFQLAEAFATQAVRHRSTRVVKGSVVSPGAERRKPSEGQGDRPDHPTLALCGVWTAEPGPPSVKKGRAKRSGIYTLQNWP